ncbi:MAG: hypothetical protein Q9192_003128 [Flavoplaca navasiana]
MNDSSTWQPNGFWQLGSERNLDIYANVLYGNDTIGLDVQGSESPILDVQVMTVIRTEKIYVGIWRALSTQENFKKPDSGRKEEEEGGGGGHDQSRFTSNNMAFSFAPDTDRDLVVGIQDKRNGSSSESSSVLLWLSFSSLVGLLLSLVFGHSESNRELKVWSRVQMKKRRGFAKAELDTEPNHAVYEMGHSGIDPDAGTLQSLVDGELNAASRVACNRAWGIASVSAAHDPPGFQLVIRSTQNSRYFTGRPVQRVFTHASVISQTGYALSIGHQDLLDPGLNLHEASLPPGRHWLQTLEALHCLTFPGPHPLGSKNHLVRFGM